ncbi:ICP22 family protein [Mycoplasmopsis gallinacea]|uniref:Uncharacterized protein n=1 Tax=Mycoplasmopsis gallinacea TaxID=29556 RepID=A0A449A3V9_9BACT|nr:hypothetical protein [Mycoplasmopsis gallinacea]VEU58894.1 Uncharacterised protein [Mycoplasmopsis gallinacea]
MKLKGKFKFLTILSGVTVVSLPFAMISCEEIQKSEKKETQPTESKPKEDTTEQPKEGGATDSETVNPPAEEGGTPTTPTNPETPGNEGVNPPAEENPGNQEGEQPDPENPETPGNEERDGDNQGTSEGNPSEETPTPGENEAQKAAEAERAKNEAVVAKFQGDEGIARFAFTTEYDDERNKSNLDFFYRDITYNDGTFKDVTFTFIPDTAKIQSEIKRLVPDTESTQANATKIVTETGSRFNSFIDVLGEEYILVNVEQTKEEGQEFTPNYSLNGKYTFGEGFTLTYKIAKRDGSFISESISTTIPENKAPIPATPSSFGFRSGEYSLSRFDSYLNRDKKKVLHLLNKNSSVEIMYETPKSYKNYDYTPEQQNIINKAIILRQRIISEFFNETTGFDGRKVYVFAPPFAELEHKARQRSLSNLIFTLDKMIIYGYAFQEYYDLVYGKPTDGEDLSLVTNTYSALVNMKKRSSSSSSSGGRSSTSPYV